MGARWMWRSAAVLAAAMVWLGVLAGGALGASVFLCVPSTTGASVTSGGPSPGTCASGTKVALPASSTDQQTLISILPHLSFISSAVAGKPTIRFTGVNVQVVNGAGSTTTVNGTGNLVLGYDENPAKRAQTGSHDLIVGRNQSFTGYAEFVAGFQNAATANYATVSGGEFNAAAGGASSVTGGCSNIAGPGTVSLNSACTNTTSSPHGFTSVTGGAGNQALTTDSSISGGQFNLASDPLASITGGCRNLAGTTGTVPSPSCASGLESITGGNANTASGDKASISGGLTNQATGADSWIGGGTINTGDGFLASIAGGQRNDASGIAASILGGDNNTVSTNCGTFPATGESC